MDLACDLIALQRLQALSDVIGESNTLSIAEIFNGDSLINGSLSLCSEDNFFHQCVDVFRCGNVDFDFES